MTDTTLPPLETERLRLRQRNLDDLDALVALDSDPQVTRFIDGGEAKDPDRLRKQLHTRVNLNFGAQRGYWSVFAKERPDHFLGWVTLVPLPGHP